MQPCHVCGGVAVDPNGYCTGCRTFRGQVNPPASGGPWSGQAAPASGAPYPRSGPPVSGGPGPPPPRGQRRPLVGVLVVGSVALVILVSAIIILVVARSGRPNPVAADSSQSPGPTASPEASAIIDTCLVGTWKATSEREQYDFAGVGPVLMVGQGQVAHIYANGTVDDDFSQATPYSGAYEGHSITMTVTGTVHSKITTAAGVLSFHDISETGMVRVLVDGVSAGSPYPLSISSHPVQYTCLSQTATEHTDGYDLSLSRVSSSP
jgi:hypothetical protein